MMPDNIPQKTWKKADEFFDALANGTTDLQQLAAKDGEIAKLQEIVRTQAEEAAKATYYYTDKMDELTFYPDIPERTITFKPNGVIEVGEAWGSDMDYASRAFLEGLVKNFPALIAGRDAHIQNLEAEIDRLEGFWGIPSLSRTVSIVLCVMGFLALLVNYLTTQQ
jgi:hypothetical protein